MSDIALLNHDLSKLSKIYFWLSRPCYDYLLNTLVFRTITSINCSIFTSKYYVLHNIYQNFVTFPFQNPLYKEEWNHINFLSPSEIPYKEWKGLNFPLRFRWWIDSEMNLGTCQGEERDDNHQECKPLWLCLLQHLYIKIQSTAINIKLFTH